MLITLSPRGPPANYAVMEPQTNADRAVNFVGLALTALDYFNITEDKTSTAEKVLQPYRFLFPDYSESSAVDRNYIFEEAAKEFPPQICIPYIKKLTSFQSTCKQQQQIYQPIYHQLAENSTIILSIIRTNDRVIIDTANDILISSNGSCLVLLSRDQNTLPTFAKHDLLKPINSTQNVSR
jgi:hypothetical protein